MAKNPTIAIVNCLECSAEIPLRRNSNGRFYAYCKEGHEHRYDNEIATPDYVPGFLRNVSNDNIKEDGENDGVIQQKERTRTGTNGGSLFNWD